MAKQKAQDKKAAAKAKAKAKKEAEKAKEIEKKAKAKAKAQDILAKAKARAKSLESGNGGGRKRKASNARKDGNGDEPMEPAVPHGLDQPEAERPAAAASSPAAGPEAEASSTAAVAGDALDAKKSFARRFRPSTADAASRFDAIRMIFNKHLNGRMKKASTMEAHYWEVPGK